MKLLDPFILLRLILNTILTQIPGEANWFTVLDLSESESRSVKFYSLQPPSQNTGVGSLSLLQGIFPTQESNWGLLHCRWILYQLSYQGSPKDVFFCMPLAQEPQFLFVLECTGPDTKET